jgi:hypothetical protein
LIGKHGVAVTALFPGGQVEINGVTLDYDVRGPAGAPPVVFSNSLGTTRAMWAPQIAAMAGRFMLSGLTHLARWHKPEGRLSARQVMQQFVDMVLFGLVQDPAPAAPAKTPATTRSKKQASNTPA